MNAITLEQAQAQLPDLIHKLIPGEEIVITENNQPAAKLVIEPPKLKPGLRPPPGLGKGCITVISDDDEHLKDFAEYMPRSFCWILMRCTGTSKAIRNSR